MPRSNTYDLHRCASFLYLDASKALRLKSGIVIGVPIKQEDAAEASVVEAAIQQAIKEAEYVLNTYGRRVVSPSLIFNMAKNSEKKVHGNDVTPFLLQRVNELTGGESLKSSMRLLYSLFLNILSLICSRVDICLIKQNAKVASQIACALSVIRAQEQVGTASG